MPESKMPAKIRVAQDADGFWTCREAVSRSPEFIRADLVEPLVEALRAHDVYMAENFNDGPDSKALHPKAAANWKRVRAALQAYEAAILRARQTEVHHDI